MYTCVLNGVDGEKEKKRECCVRCVMHLIVMVHTETQRREEPRTIWVNDSLKKTAWSFDTKMTHRCQFNSFRHTFSSLPSSRSLYLSHFFYCSVSICKEWKFTLDLFMQCKSIELLSLNRQQCERATEWKEKITHQLNSICSVHWFEPNNVRCDYLPPVKTNLYTRFSFLWISIVVDIAFCVHLKLEEIKCMFFSSLVYFVIFRFSGAKKTFAPIDTLSLFSWAEYREIFFIALAIICTDTNTSQTIRTTIITTKTKSPRA